MFDLFQPALLGCQRISLTPCWLRPRCRQGGV